MQPRTTATRILSAAALIALPVFAACTTQTESVEQSSAALFTNGDFETGTTGLVPPSPWALTTYLNPGVTVQTPQTRAGLNLGAGGVALTTTIAASNAAQADLGNLASLRVCRYGAKCAQIDYHSSNAYGGGANAQSVNSLTQTMTVTNGDVDPNDNIVHVRFAVAPVLENPAHAAAQQPYYFVQLTNVTTNTILYTDFNLSAQLGVPWKCVNCGTANEIDYTDWQLVDIAPGNTKIKVTDQLKVELIASGCSLGGHFGELYVDGVGASVPGLFVSGTAPAQANAGSNLTYSLTYKNGGQNAASSVVTDFTTPPGTTFQSLVAPNGANCTAPGVGTTGTVVCTFAGNIAAGASGTYSVTVQINNNAVGSIVQGNYDIKSAQESALLGSHITTLIGCALDVDCLAGNWCNISQKACTPTLSNGVAVPSDLSHVSPVINGVCNVNAGKLVCTSTVCDTVDNKCGFANGDGPCTVQNGGTVCRSGSCSVSGVCKASGACLVDADCSGNNWCNISTKTCTPQLANGVVVPSDPAHVTPILNSKCTQPAATLVCTSAVCDTVDDKCGYTNGVGPCSSQNGGVVCRSAVCDPDLKCGFANGDGPCTNANAGTVCRSGACSVNSTCRPQNGCNVDGDCSAGNWCNMVTNQCTPQLANGVLIASDPAHVMPVLNAKCTQAAATLVCVSSVCDTVDDKCGYVDGSGPCTVQNGGTVCRSAACSQNGLCMPAMGCNVDADCGMGTWCNETMHMCMPTLANGVVVPTDAPHMNPVLNAKCTQAAATLVCTSAVCDTVDDKCGFTNGVGPCDAMSGAKVCRSLVCDPDKLCGFANGTGPCTSANAGTVCRSSHCASGGPNVGKCEACDTDVDCSGATPACDAKTNVCGQCSATNATACTGSTPLCDTTSDKCVPCDGDANDAAANHACPSTSPLCLSTGDCGKCTKNADCANHAGGAICDVPTGACTQKCTSDSDCDTAKQWCNAEPKSTGACVAKLPNGTHLPSSPSDVSTCTDTVAARVCATGACDPKADTCGAAEPGAPGTPGSTDVTLSGGGCGCYVGPTTSTSGTTLLSLSGLAIAGAAVRRRRRR